jgi:translation elongation factor EF-Ts
VLVELKCETDFVAKGEDFVATAQQIADAIARYRAASPEGAIAWPKSLADLVSDSRGNTRHQHLRRREDLRRGPPPGTSRYPRPHCPARGV